MQSMNMHERSAACVAKERGIQAASQDLTRRLARCLDQLQRSRITLLLELDHTLRVLGMDLRDEDLYTGDLQLDVLVRTRLCTQIFRERLQESRKRLAECETPRRSYRREGSSSRTIG